MKKTIALILMAAAMAGCVKFKSRSGYEGGFDATGETVKGSMSDPVGNSAEFDIPKAD